MKMFYIGIDQCGGKHVGIKTPTKAGIREYFCLPKNAKVDHMYIDKKDGTTKQVGFIIDRDNLWLTLYRADAWEIDAE